MQRGIWLHVIFILTAVINICGILWLTQWGCGSEGGCQRTFLYPSHAGLYHQYHLTILSSLWSAANFNLIGLDMKKKTAFVCVGRAALIYCYCWSLLFMDLKLFHNYPVDVRHLYFNLWDRHGTKTSYDSNNNSLIWLPIISKSVS